MDAESINYNLLVVAMRLMIIYDEINSFENGCFYNLRDIFGKFIDTADGLLLKKPLYE